MLHITLCPKQRIEHELLEDWANIGLGDQNTFFSILELLQYFLLNIAV